MSSVKFLLLLHGDLLLGLMAGSLLGLIVSSAAVFWLWKRPPRAPALPALVYLLAVFVFCIVAMASDKDSLLILAAIFSFPWSFVWVILGSFLEVDFGESFLFLGIMINAFLVYQIGKTAKNRNEQQLH